jgi:hypothetical protein
MKINTKAVRGCLQAFDFQTLFREHLGWDVYKAQLDIHIDGQTYSLRADARLCRVSEDVQGTDPQVICSLGLKEFK